MRGVGKGAMRRAHHPTVRAVKTVGTLRFAHPTIYDFIIDTTCTSR
jgi:hypothetical protein